MPKLTVCHRCEALSFSLKENRCRMCGSRTAARMPRKRSRRILLRQELRASRWISTLCTEQKLRSGKTDAQIVRRVYALHEELLPRFTWKQIGINGLDNPYMTDLARRVIVNQVLGYDRRLMAAKKKPVRSVKRNYTTAGRNLGPARRAA